VSKSLLSRLTFARRLSVRVYQNSHLFHPVTSVLNLPTMAHSVLAIDVPLASRIFHYPSEFEGLSNLTSENLARWLWQMRRGAMKAFLQIPLTPIRRGPA